MGIARGLLGRLEPAARAAAIKSVRGTLAERYESGVGVRLGAGARLMFDTNRCTLCGVDIPPLEAHQRHLTKRIATICGHRNVADAQLVAVVAEAIETGAWFMAGIKSPEHFVAWQTGSSSSRAHHIVARSEERRVGKECA